MDLEPLTLPAAAAEPQRQPIPVLAAVVPIISGVVLWLVTGSVFSLCFAALGPLMIGASLLDGLRNRRRERRKSAEEEAEGWRRAEQDLRRRHRRELRELRREHPDAASSLQEPPLRDLEPVDEKTPIVIGAGSRRSALRVSGDDSERSRAFRERAAAVQDAPIVVPMGRGICLRGPLPVVAAAARALIVQLCLQYAPSQLTLCGDGLDALGVAGFPHAGRVRRGAWRLAVVIGDGDVGDAPAQVRLRGAGGEVPEGITTVIDVLDPSVARARYGKDSEEIIVECLSQPQTIAIAAESVENEVGAAQLPDVVALGELTAGSGPGLTAVIGRTESNEVAIDIVEDGPHAIVTGMTGSGKSELLVTWIAAMALSHSPEEVAFVLADFKGGTAFDPLRGLPHVTAVMTDLDEEGARRGVQSLTAELRRREAVLAEGGARNIAEAGGCLGRLVIVVDEFAALLQEHPDLAGVFTDIAARGRALGMHLILGTQRAAGVIRDALAANCPLRVSLRVADAADSRLVIGSDDAAALPGGVASRGLAFVRRPQDSQAMAVRIALTAASDLRTAGARWMDAAILESPWLPALPTRLPLGELAAGQPPTNGELLLGLADEPELQRQIPVTLRPGSDRGLAIIGGSGSGRSSVLRLLEAQSERVVRIPSDAEQAWDLIAALDEGEGPSGDLVICDDLDQLVSSLPVEYAQIALERIEKLVRSAAVRKRSVVVTVGRVSGQLARVLEALPTRALLRTGSKLEHLAAGGDSDGFRRDRSPGRARMDEREVQLAWVESDAAPALPAPNVSAEWAPGADVIGVIAPGVRRVTAALSLAHPEYEVLPVGEQVGTAQRRIIVGDGDSWQRQWGLWQQVRADGEMLVLAECATELRSLAGYRQLPPYAEMHRGRAWSIADGRRPARVTLSALDPSIGG